MDEIMGEYGITVSIGIAEFDRASMTTSDDLIQAADMDMYSAKAHRGEQKRAASP